jgi:hypothetical protein
MAGVDAELVARVVRWCGDAGRQTAPEDVRRALAPLGWDELLAVRALLADPPPIRPLGPHAVADIARGAPPDLAAEREREGRYRGAEGEAPADAADAGAGPGRPLIATRAPVRTARRGRDIVIRRARDAAPAAAPAARAAPAVEDLLRPEGRGVLERLLRAHGGRRTALAAALARGWSGRDGAVPGEADLALLLEHHGLLRGFERRERDEMLHALRAAGGVRSAAAERLGLDAAALDAALARLGATADAERIREARRADLRARATLSERVRLVLAEEERLRDLGLLGELEDDLRARLPEHLRALRGGAGPMAPALARSLSVTPAQARALAARFGLDLGPRPAPPPRHADVPRGPARRRDPSAPPAARRRKRRAR